MCHNSIFDLIYAKIKVVLFFLTAFPLASYFKQRLPKKPKAIKIANTSKLEVAFATFKIKSPVLTRKNLFIG